MESGDVIYDMIKFIGPLCASWAQDGSPAPPPTSIWRRKKSLLLPNARYLVHQPSGGSESDATDIKIQMEEILKTKQRINQIIANETGQPIERVEQDTDRDYWMSAEEAIEYGIVGAIILSIDEIK